jgi:hypothetical protein
LEQLPVVLVDMPQMLREIVKLSLPGDMRVVREIASADDLVAVAAETGAEVFIGDMASGVPGAAPRVFDRFPHPLVVALDGVGRRGVVYTLRPHAKPMGVLSPQRLLTTIRSGLHDPDATT